MHYSQQASRHNATWKLDSCWILHLTLDTVIAILPNKLTHTRVGKATFRAQDNHLPFHQDARQVLSDRTRISPQPFWVLCGYTEASWLGRASQGYLCHLQGSWQTAQFGLSASPPQWWPKLVALSWRKTLSTIQVQSSQLMLLLFTYGARDSNLRPPYVCACTIKGKVTSIVH